MKLQNVDLIRVEESRCYFAVRPADVSVARVLFDRQPGGSVDAHSADTQAAVELGYEELVLLEWQGLNMATS